MMERPPRFDESLQTIGYYIGTFPDLSILEIARQLVFEKTNSVSLTPFRSWEDLTKSYASRSTHKLLSSKKSRLFGMSSPAEQALTYYLHKFFSSLIGNFVISDEESFGHPEIYWRIVRPNEQSDVGPLHADSWFWELNNWLIPARFTQRTKVWIPLATEIGLNGLLALPGSHLQTYNYTIEYDGSKRKPRISSYIDKHDIILLNVPHGSYVIFNDRLIHGGAFNAGIQSRISFEFTCLH